MYIKKSRRGATAQFYALLLNNLDLHLVGLYAVNLDCDGCLTNLVALNDNLVCCRL